MTLKTTTAKCTMTMMTGEIKKASRNEEAGSRNKKTSNSSLLTPHCIGTLALEAMLVEVSVTPKPGLVDSNNSGAHRDMGFFTFIKSAAALRDSFEEFARAGENFASENSDIKNLNSIPDLVPQDALKTLESDGIQFVRARRRLDEYIVDVHNYLLPHVPNCQKFLPEWVKWPYVRNLFFINRGNTIEGNKEAARIYSEFRDLFPYQSFINWNPDEGDGNILRDDAKFLPILYERNRDRFYDMSKVTEAGDAALTSPEDFFANSERVIIAVDCENADPCKVIGIIKDLDAKGLVNKIAKILLVDDEHTSSQWRALRRNEKLPLEYYLTDRVKDEKSAVDVALTIKFYREISELRNSDTPVDSAIIISSDCDFWPLIELTPEVKFLVMLEYDNCSQAYYQRLQNNDVPFFYIDEYFTSGNIELKTEVVLQEVIHEIEENHLSKLNLFSVINRALSKIDLKMNEAEIMQFIEKYIANMTIGFAKNGSAVLQNKPVLKY